VEQTQKVLLKKVEKETLEEKIGQCIGLEMGAQNAVSYLNSIGLFNEEKVKKKLFEMWEEAKMHEDKMNEMLGWLKVYAAFDITKIHQKGREIEGKVADMMKAYLGEKPDTQEALEFLCLAEAAELTHYEVLHSISNKINYDKFRSLVKDILDQEKKHLQRCTKLAKEYASKD
jgi:rubrerythrin